MKLYQEEIALAMELKAAGFNWKCIGLGLGCHWSSVRDAVKKAQHAGRIPRPSPVLATKSRSDDLPATQPKG